jgi:heptosyltransferase-3
MKNILFITCSRIGDAVLTSGILAEIEHRYPKAKVTIAVDPLPAPLFEDFPLLDDLIVFAKERRSKHWLTLWKKVVGRRWDWVIDLRGSAISYGLLTKKRSIWKSKSGDPRHKVEQVSALAGFETVSPTLWFSKERLQKVEKLFDKKTPYLAVAPAANWIGKQWPIESFAELLKLFMEKYPKAKIAVFAAPHEKNMVEPMLEKLPDERVLSFIDSGLSLIETAACIKQCKTFIGNDSGLMHISAAVQTPTIGLFGPSREKNYGPWQAPGENRNVVVRIPMTYDELQATPGFSHKSEDCYMTSLTVDKVWTTLETHWEKANSTILCKT